MKNLTKVPIYDEIDYQNQRYDNVQLNDIIECKKKLNYLLIVMDKRRACSSTGETSKSLLDKFVNNCQPTE